MYLQITKHVTSHDFFFLGGVGFRQYINMLACDRTIQFMDPIQFYHLDSLSLT